MTSNERYNYLHDSNLTTEQEKTTIALFENDSFIFETVLANSEAVEDFDKCFDYEKHTGYVMIEKQVMPNEVSVGVYDIPDQYEDWRSIFSRNAKYPVVRFLYEFRETGRVLIGYAQYKPSILHKLQSICAKPYMERTIHDVIKECFKKNEAFGYMFKAQLVNYCYGTVE